MNVIKKTRLCMIHDILALGLSAAILTGATIMPTANRPTEQTPTKKYATIKEAAEVLKVGRGEIDLNLLNGYKALRADEGNIRTLAGIYAGTVNVKRTEDGYVTEGSYSQSRHPGSMEKVLKEADTNEDKIVTPQEVRDLAAELYKENSK